VDPVPDPLLGVMVPHFRIIIIIIIDINTPPCGGGLEYLHRSTDSHRRRPKGNPVPGDVLVTVPPSHWRGEGHKYRKLVLQVGGSTQGRQPCSVKSIN
jgi:hypothetical protein